MVSYKEKKASDIYHTSQHVDKSALGVLQVRYAILRDERNDIPL